MEFVRVCSDADHAMTLQRGLFSHLAAIVMHDIQSGHADLPPSATLDTLVISKRSILLETEYPRYAFERMLDAVRLLP